MPHSRPALSKLMSALLLCAVTTALAKPTPHGERVFVTAHSFHIFVATRLSPMVKAAGITGHQLVGAQVLGSSRVQQHWELPDEKNPAKAALREGKVDVLTMSPNWIVPDEGIEKFVELGLKTNPKLRVLVQESWIPWDGWLPEEKVADNTARDARPLDSVRTATQRFKDGLEPQLVALNAKLGRDAIQVVPADDAVMKLRELVAAGRVPGITKQSDLFKDTIGHGRAAIEALVTYCNFACLYRLNPIGLKDAAPELDKISPDLQALLQRLAWEAVTAHPLSGVSL